VTGWQPDWQALARRCVHDTLGIAAGERVVCLGDPNRVPVFYEAFRYELLAAGAVDHAHVLGWRGRINELRGPFGRHRDERVAALEIEAMRDLLATADVFCWLPVSLDPIGCGGGYSEAVLADWQGRGLHFHWFDDWYLDPDDPLQVTLAQALERAVLELDYDAHRAAQDRLLAAVRGRLLRITTPDGTDVRVQLAADAWYHVNDGRVTAEKHRHASCARDREEEIPCGSVRTVPVIESVEGVVRHRSPGKAFGSFGFHLLDVAADLTLELHDGRITSSSGGALDREWQQLWTAQAGSFDEVTEIVFGTNPFLHEIAGVPMLPYWGFGEGYVRLHTGANVESGGDRNATMSLELWQREATVSADGDEVIVDGKVVV
jgi:hypothetical protein